MKINSILTDTLSQRRYVYSNYKVSPSKLLYTSFWNLSKLDILKFDIKENAMDTPISLGVLPFLEKQHDDLIIATEIFTLSNSGTLNIGSSRHCTLGALQIKGNGNNRSSMRNDFTHSFGGVTHEECKLEYLRSSICIMLNSINASVIGYGIVNDQGKSRYCLYRNFNVFRIPNLKGGQLNNQEKENLKNYLQVSYHVSSFEDGFNLIAEKIKLHLELNIFQSALALDNFSLMHDLIDFDGVKLNYTYLKPSWIIAKKSESNLENKFYFDNFTSEFIYFFKNAIEVLKSIYGVDINEGELFEKILQKLDFKQEIKELLLYFFKESDSNIQIHQSLHDQGYYQLPSEIYSFWLKNAVFLEKMKNFDVYHIEIFNESHKQSILTKIEYGKVFNLMMDPDINNWMQNSSNLNYAINYLKKDLVVAQIQVQKLIEFIKDHFIDLKKVSLQLDQEDIEVWPIIKLSKGTHKFIQIKIQFLNYEVIPLNLWSEIVI